MEEPKRLHLKYYKEEYGSKTYYPNGHSTVNGGINLKVVTNDSFRSEFIINGDGKFLKLLDKEATQDAKVNCSSFNYARRNDKVHTVLDVEPSNPNYEPQFRENSKHVFDKNMLQAIIVTIWDAVLCGSIALAGGSDSSVGYLTAIGLTVVIYLAAYVLFFLGYFVLILRKGDMKREFHIPGGRAVKIVVAAVGLFMTVVTLVISFFPSSKLTAADNRVYQIVLIVCFIVSMAAPLVIYANRHRWLSNGKATGDEK